MDVIVTIGADSSDDCVAVTISDDTGGWSPDQLTDAVNRASNSALYLWRELHATPAD